MSATEKLYPEPAACKVCSQSSFRQRLGDGHFLPAFFVLSPWEDGCGKYWCAC